MSASNNPRVSVVIPVYNRPLELTRALKSVALQTYPSLEVVVVDDASTQDISCAFEALSGRKDITLVHVKNETSRGAQASRIRGCEVASSEVVALLDSDDWWMPTKISRQMESLSDNPTALISCRSLLTSSGVVLPRRLMRPDERAEEYLYATAGGFLQSSTFLMSRDVLKAGLIACQDYRVHDDTWLAIYLRQAGHPIVQVDEQLAFFDDRPKQDRISFDKSMLNASLAWMERYAQGWSRRARAGYLLVDVVPRALHLGMRGDAAKFLLHGLHPALPIDLMIRTAANVVFNGSPLRFFRSRNSSMSLRPDSLAKAL